MFKIPLEKIIEIIKEKTSLTDEDINAKIQEKLDQLSGLVSKEGAAHIIANELGVKLLELPKGSLQIKNILSGMRNVETIGRVTQKFDLKEFKTESREGKLASFVLADETGSIRVVMWNSQAEKIKDINLNDTLKIKSGYAKDNQGRLEIHLNDKSELLINPSGEKAPEIKQHTSTRKHINDLKGNESDIELLGTIVQVYDPRFYEVCPQCNRRASLKDDSFFCNTHGKVNPNFSYVLNLLLDDGTENIRTVFFRDLVEKLFNKSSDDILKFKDSISEFVTLKNDLLGTQLRVIGRSTKNEMFDRLEFIAQKIEWPKPEEELERLEKEA